MNMSAVKLILIEGLTGAGKSTTAQRLWLHLERHGHAARWFYEHDTTHPVWLREEQSRMAEAGRIDPGLLETTLLARWRNLADECSSKGGVTILESTFFQSTVGFLLCMNIPDKDIAAHVLAVDRVIAEASPVLIYFRHDDVSQWLRTVFEDRRSDNYEANLVRYIGMTPYGKATGLSDVAGLVRFLEHWRELAEALFAQIGMAKLAIDGDSGNWTSRERQITDFLGLPEIVEPSVRIEEPDRFCGRYRDAASSDEFVVARDEQGLYLADARRTRLIHKHDNTFHIAAMPVEMSFGDGSGGVFRRIDLKGPLPGLSPVWLRADDGGL
jgi:hypothetical protein